MQVRKSCLPRCGAVRAARTRGRRAPASAQRGSSAALLPLMALPADPASTRSGALAAAGRGAGRRLGPGAERRRRRGSGVGGGSLSSCRGPVPGRGAREVRHRPWHRLPRPAPIPSPAGARRGPPHPLPAPTPCSRPASYYLRAVPKVTAHLAVAPQSPSTHPSPRFPTGEDPRAEALAAALSRLGPPTHPSPSLLPLSWAQFRGRGR